MDRIDGPPSPPPWPTTDSSLKSVNNMKGPLISWHKDSNSLGSKGQKMDRTDGSPSPPPWPGTYSSLKSDDNTKGVHYDVFLSFKGEDTRISFTSHLYSSLSKAGILVFKDDTDLLLGDNILTELKIGIESSTISIIIFSRDYGGSTWCLNELSIIMEIRRAKGQVVLPVFYDIEPSQVRHQNGDFLDNLIKSRSPKEDEVLRWKRDVLEASSILGFVVNNSRDESEEIKDIVERVRELLDKKDLFIASHPVGVNSHMQDVIQMSESHPPNDVFVWPRKLTGGHDSKNDRARYEVYLNFRGIDIRRSFTAHLYSSLSNAGILVFKDDAKHLKGLDLDEMLRGIECSTVFIIIFSSSYAQSSWCLKELSKIMELHREQGREVLPVFYQVHPSDVRHQRRTFKDASCCHTEKSLTNVSRWKADLRDTANLSGFVVKYTSQLAEAVTRVKT